ncbi:capsule assembly Wzi family protein [Spirosoma luteolum]
MSRRSIFYGLILAGLLGRSVCGQALPDTTTRPRLAYIELGGLAATAAPTPFWLRSRQYGIVPLGNPAGLVRLGGVLNRALTTRPRGLRLRLGAEVVGQAGPSGGRLLLPEAYAQLRLGVFELYGGRRRDVFGLVDTLLSSGSYAWSGNALPLPKVQLGTAGFVPLGFTRNWLAINAFMAHGWFAGTDSIQGSYLHQKAVYLRLGKPGGRVQLYGGLLHNAQWGGRSDYRYRRLYPNNGQLPSSLADFGRVLVAKAPEQAPGNNVTEHDALNQIGNHLGSVDLGATVRLTNWQLLGYYQHPFEDKSGLQFANWPDGLYGLSLRRPGAPAGGFRIDHLLLEVLSTLDQSGTVLPFGLDDYFNNYQYLDGWTTGGRTIGTPFIGPKADLRPALVAGTTRTRFAVGNNQLTLLHLGVAGRSASGLWVQLLVSASRNQGIMRAPFRMPVNQLSAGLTAGSPVSWLGGADLRLSLALDQGDLYPASAGAWLALRKTLVPPGR